MAKYKTKQSKSIKKTNQLHKSKRKKIASYVRRDPKGRDHLMYKIDDQVISARRLKEALEIKEKQKQLGIQHNEHGGFAEGNVVGHISSGKYSPKFFMDTYNAYMKDCQKKEAVPSIAGFCLKLDINKSTIHDWKLKGFPGVAEAFEKIKTLQEFKMMNKGMNARNPAFQIFMLKANHGYIETDRRISTKQVQHNVNIVNYTDKHKVKAEDVKVKPSKDK